MSLIRSRVNLTHLVTIQRDASIGASDNGWGNPNTPNWQDHLVGVPCRVWTDAGREAVDATTIVVVEDIRLIVPLGTDVVETDRLSDVTLRGTTVLPGPTLISAVLRNTDHLELVLVRLS